MEPYRCSTEARSHLPRQRRRWGGLRIAAVSLSAWGTLQQHPRRGLCQGFRELERAVGPLTPHRLILFALLKYLRENQRCLTKYKS